MTELTTFRTTRLSGRAPEASARGLYERLFVANGAADLDRDIQDWDRHRIAPWTLAHAGHDVGVGGFRIGFGDDGLEVLFHFLPEVWGQGLASEFLIAAMDHARGELRASRFFGTIAAGADASRRIMEKAGFASTDARPDGAHVMRLG